MDPIYPTPHELQRTPKVLLHDHLDGGVRPSTLIDLARAAGYRGLPSHDPTELHTAIQDEARGSLVGYLDTFRYTLAAMQTPEALRRVASEAAEDFLEDGIAYAEVRFAPEAHRGGGMTMDQAIEAVLAGFETRAADVQIGLLCTLLRHRPHGMEVVEAATRFLGAGVVGVDVAGPEAGFPASDHARAVGQAREAGLAITIHAGEAAGISSIEDALAVGAMRIGHGVRIIDDTTHDSAGRLVLGELATRLADRRTPLELCPTSNVDTGAVPAFARHPITDLLRAGVSVTVNTDNRLMSNVSLGSEFARLVDEHDWGWAEIHRATTTALEAAFCSPATRSTVRATVEQWYAGRMTPIGGTGPQPSESPRPTSDSDR